MRTRIRVAVFVLLAALAVVPADAQLVVMDPGNLAETVLIASRTLQEYQKLIEQSETIRRLAQRLGPMDRYRTPPIAFAGHDPARFTYGAPWLQGFNGGDPGGRLYEQTTRPLQRPTPAMATLATPARRSVENAYATIEITDSIAQRGAHQVALVRGYAGQLQKATQALEDDIVNPRSAYHEMTAVLDKVAAAELIGRRQDTATNQLLSHALEQLLVRSKRLRDTEAAAMNMRLIGMRDGRTAGTALVAGAASDLRTWRQP